MLRPGLCQHLRLLEAEVAKEFLQRVVEQGAERGVDLQRALHGRRHAAGSLGQSEEFSTER